MPNDVSSLAGEGDLNLWELLGVVKQGWLWLIGGAVSGLAAAIGFITVVPAQYEAAALIQLATVGIDNAAKKGVEVESTVMILERLKMPTFYSENLLKACDVKPQANPQQMLAKALKPTLVKGNHSLIQISYRAESADMAKACITEVLSQLSKIQASLAQPILDRLQGELKLTKQRLDESERFQRQIEERVMAMDLSDAKDSHSILMLNAVLSLREEITKLRILYNEQSLMLTEPLTRPTKLFEPIYASDKVVFPKKSLTALYGLIGGLVLGGVVLFMRRELVTK